VIRHPRRDSETISFLSFLSVVSCTIGVLMFVLAGVTVVSFWGAEQVVMDVRQVGDGRPGFGRVYVECRASGLILHPRGKRVSAEELAAPRQWTAGPFGECLGRLSGAGRGGSLFFLVRPRGFAVFRQALSYAFAAGGGTADAVADGRARFSVGHQMVRMPGAIRVQPKTRSTAP